MYEPSIHKRNSVGNTLCKGTSANVSEKVGEITCKLCLAKIKELAEKTIKQLEDKVEWVVGNRMPSCVEIADLLELMKIPYTLGQSTGRHAKGKRYKGRRLACLDLVLDTGERGYSEKSWGYAKRLLEIIEPNRGGL